MFLWALDDSAGTFHDMPFTRASQDVELWMTCVGTKFHTFFSQGRTYHIFMSSGWPALALWFQGISFTLASDKVGLIIFLWVLEDLCWKCGFRACHSISRFNYLKNCPSKWITSPTCCDARLKELEGELEKVELPFLILHGSEVRSNKNTPLNLARALLFSQQHLKRNK
jgi:hypothetical protein